MILGADGLPIPAQQVPARRARADVTLNGMPLQGNAPYVFPYEAADWVAQEMGNWLPWIRSPDSETTPYRDRMVARSRDLSRNDGWIYGAVNRILDNTIGTSLKLSANPDYRAARAAYRHRSL